MTKTAKKALLTAALLGVVLLVYAGAASQGFEWKTSLQGPHVPPELDERDVSQP